MDSNYHIVLANESDASVLTEIAFASKGYWGYPEAWLEEWRDEIEVTPSFIATNSVYKVVDPQNNPVGFSGLEFLDERWILSGFWIHPDYMGKGLGKMLYSHMMQVAEKKGASSVQWESDPNSAAFYKKCGAKQVDSKTYDLDGSPRTLPILEQSLPLIE